jgi:hypothetical protein
MNIQDLTTEVRRLISEAETVSKAQEDAERKEGKILFDNPACRLLEPPTPSVKLLQPPDRQESIYLRESGNESEFFLKTGETKYLTSRRGWKAYPEAKRLAGPFGKDGEMVLFEHFHFLVGALALVERDNHFLVGVRSNQLAGTHPGMASFPGGIINPGEGVLQGIRRELAEETSIRETEYLATGLGWNPTAPNPTFVCNFRTEVKNVSKTYEVKGKSFIWIPASIVRSALYGHTGGLNHSFKDSGLSLSAPVEIAPDARVGARNVLS